MGLNMSSKFKKVIEALLPHSRQWNLTKTRNMERLFAAIAVLPEDLRREIEAVYLDRFPETTRSPEKWEQVFQVIFTSAELEIRRNVLAGLWQMNNSGGAIIFLRRVLQEVWPEIQVVENVPVGNTRGPNAVSYMVCGNDIACCGNRKAVCGYREGDGDFETTILRNDTASSYTIPNDPAWWRYCFYVCKEAVRDSRGVIIYVRRLEIPKDYKNYIEYFILRMKQVQCVAVMAIKWV